MTLKVGLAPPTNFWTLDADARREMVAAGANRAHVAWQHAYHPLPAQTVL